MFAKYPTLGHSSAFALLVLAGTSCMPADHGVNEAAPGAAPDTARSDTAAPLTADSWNSTVQAAITADSRAFHADGLGFIAHTSGITARVSKGTLFATGGDGALAVRFSGWGRDHDLRPTEARLPTLGACTKERNPEGDCIRRVETDQDGVTEWFASVDGGIEQGWTLDQRPEGSAELVFEVAMAGADLEVDAARNEGGVVDANGGTWRVSEVAAWDANGEALPARLEGEGDAMRVVVDDAGATYPIEVDPVYTTASATLTGPSASQFGYSVAAAGDVNGDGYGDVLVGAPYYLVDQGAAYLYLGSASGLTNTATSTIVGATGTLLGVSLKGAGDVNGDGYADVIVGAAWGGAGGRAYVYNGTSTGLSGTPTTLSVTDVTFFGFTVSGAGDVNADGFDDVIVGATSSTSGPGQVFVFLGASVGVSTTAATTIPGTAGGSFGYSVSDAGDVNNDGYDDFLATDFRYSSSDARVYVYHGSLGVPSSTAATILTGAASTRFARVAGRAGDVNGDGYDDVIVGAVFAASNFGQSYIYHGSETGVSTAADTTLDNPTPAVSQFGYAVSAAGDVDHDGYDDVVVGAFGGSGLGSAVVFRGSSAGVVSATSTQLSGPSTNGFFGRAVSGAGDVNGDGYDDVMVGAFGTSAASGAAYLFEGYVDADGDGYASTADCDEDNAEIHPGATEICDGIDNNCDASIDEGVTFSGYADLDEDGFGDPTNTADACTLPSGYTDDNTDCDDWDDSVHPGQDELCDRLDNDCDGTIDGTDAVDAMLWFADADGDFYGDPTVTGLSCDLPDDATYDNTDCDDTNTLVSPEGIEACNGYDDDCDGVTDGPGSQDETTWYADTDSDGFGNAELTELACSLPTGFTTNAADCDDTNGAVSPSATETCNLIDDDCDSQVDEPGTAGELVFYADADQDGHGDLAFPSTACFDTAYTAESDDDCDDTTATTYPGASEYCNEVDDDCNSIVDDPTAVDAITWYRDLDGDGYGVPRRPVRACEIAPGYVTNSTDCRPADAASYPGAPELCDGHDNDCDATVDEPGSVGQPAWFTDADGDTFGAGAVVSYSCTQPSGQQPTDTDCNDGNVAVYPGAIESCNTIDDDCDGSTDEAGSAGEVARYLDADGDLYGDPASALFTCDGVPGRIDDGTDCNDTESTTYPGAPERCDGVQNDCDVPDWTTADEDGEVWLSDGGGWTSYTSDWSTGTYGHPTVITLPADGNLNVCAGTYYVRLTASLSGTLSVEGTDGDAVLSAGGVGSVVTVSGASTHLNLLGVTLEDGAGSGSPRRGGGLRVTAGTVTVDDCLLQNSTAASGGGFAVLGGTVTLSNSEVSNNSSTSTTANTGGGGWYQSGGTLTLTDTDVVNNTALRDGGGGYVSAGTFSATRGEFSYNTAAYSGGGMRLTGASTLTDASISYNTATAGSGGGVYHATNTLVLNTPVVQGNTAPAGSGGGVYQGAGALTCVGTTSDPSGFFTNSAAIGGGVYLPQTSTFRSTICGFGDTTPTNNTPTDVQDGIKTYNYGNDVTFVCSGGTCR